MTREMIGTNPAFSNLYLQYGNNPDPIKAALLYCTSVLSDRDHILCINRAQLRLMEGNPSFTYLQPESNSEQGLIDGFYAHPGIMKNINLTC